MIYYLHVKNAVLNDDFLTGYVARNDDVVEDSNADLMAFESPEMAKLYVSEMFDSVEDFDVYTF